jgi:hypothetical protein
MAEIILNIGPSGTGKTTGLRNLPPEQTLIIKPNAKSIAFPNSEKNYILGKNLIVTDSMSMAKKVLVEAKDKFKYFVIEDLNHFFNARTTSPSFIAQKDGGAAFAKWNQFAADILQDFIFTAKELPTDSYLIILAHTEYKDDGTIGMQTSGKLLESNLYVPGYTNYILHSIISGDAKDPDYYYLCKPDGLHLAKSKVGSLEKQYRNDMFKVLQQIELYKQGKSTIPIKFKE